jgi:hypothetical protein
MARSGVLLGRPVRSWWLQHVKLVAVWVGKDVPAPFRSLTGRSIRTWAPRPSSLASQAAPIGSAGSPAGPPAGTAGQETLKPLNGLVAGRVLLCCHAFGRPGGRCRSQHALLAVRRLAACV